MKSTLLLAGLIFLFDFSPAQGLTKNFIFSSPSIQSTIYVGKDEEEVVTFAANALADDIEDITGRRPQVSNDAGNLQGNVIVFGTIKNAVVSNYLQQDHLPDIKNKWEHFLLKLLPADKSGKRILLIAGSDPRGAAYGAFSLSRIIGVSPWKWWADVIPGKKEVLEIPANISLNEGPSVKYRGIFLNDEDWGLRPWASKTFEPEVGNIGPKTYAKIFELLLRLKANTIWPAMHPGTTAFFDNPGNEQVAKRFDIVVGTSHAEPMLRNNVGEWNTKTMGEFNYLTNRDSVYDYWKKRVEQVANDKVIYTLGMRGIHDSQMEGAETVEQQKSVLTQVLKDQRNLLKEYVNRDETKVPQVFIPYKEVLPIYDAGLKLPDDATLMWTDDNYGYIRRLSNKAERKRSGSAGVYYHLSYWGRPHDYLWLSSTQPGLIWQEMKKAWDYGAQRIWIANVGDIKPAEYNIQFFLDMAWNIGAIKHNTIYRYMNTWHENIFGKKDAGAITKVMDEYYRLAAIRKPEFMGWSQTEPETPTKNSDFRAFYNGDEIERRIIAYKKLMKQVDEIQATIPDIRKDAYFELIAYPVKGAAYLNEKLLYAQKSRLFAKYDLPVANEYAARSWDAYGSIKILTEKYNNEIAGGKWKNMMSMAPRNLAVFQEPVVPQEIKSFQKGIRIWLEGNAQPMIENHFDSLPSFNSYSAKQHFIALFNEGVEPIKWQAKAAEPWIVLDKETGRLKAEEKINVSIDPEKIPADKSTGSITVLCGDSTYTINIRTERANEKTIPPHSIVEADGHVFIQAYQFAEKHNYSPAHQWKPVQQLGYSDSAYTILPIPLASAKEISSAFLEYRFYSFSKGSASITAFMLPTLPVNDSAGMRIAISVDNGPKETISYKTIGRSDEWKENVLSNHARCETKHNFTKPGWHSIKVYPLDPGVVLDQLLINFKTDEKIYAAPHLSE